MSLTRALASASPRISNYDLTLPVGLVRKWKVKSSLRIDCDNCGGTGIKNVTQGTCTVCEGAGKINPYIYDYLDPKQTRVTKITFNNELFAWAMAGAPDGVYRMMLCKYAGGTQNDHQLLVKLAAAVAQAHAAKQSWKLDKCREDTLDKVALAALSESILLYTCARCRGRGEVVEKGKAVECPPPPRGCGGSGRRPRSLRSRASLSQLSHPAFLQTWQNRYMQLLSIYLGWESDGLSRLYYRLRENDKDEHVIGWNQPPLKR